jgi:hypothetical protein
MSDSSLRLKIFRHSKNCSTFKVQSFNAVSRYFLKTVRNILHFFTQISNKYSIKQIDKEFPKTQIGLPVSLT